MKKQKKDSEKKLEEIKKALGDFDLVLPGALRKLFMKCGKSGCACHADKKARHGPYHLWDRKIGQKLSSKMLSKDDLDDVRRGIEARKQLEALVAEAIRLSQEMATKKIDEKKIEKSITK